MRTELTPEEETSYRGETNAKKLARLMFWTNAIQRHSTGSKILFFASAEGGDIPVLRALGVRDRDMVPVDEKGEAARLCSAKWGLPVVVGDGVEHLKRSPKSYSLVFFDFCGHVNPVRLKACQDAFLAMGAESVFAVNVKRGRERDARVRTRLKAIEAFEKSEAAEEGIDLSDGRFDVRRARVIQEAMIRASILHRRVPMNQPILSSVINYQSWSEDSGGSPMSTCSFVIKQRQDPAECYAQEAAFFDTPGRFIVHERITLDVLRGVAVRLLATKSAETVAGLLNIEASTIVAWKAHATRGTYAQGKHGSLVAKGTGR